MEKCVRILEILTNQILPRTTYLVCKYSFSISTIYLLNQYTALFIDIFNMSFIY